MSHPRGCHSPNSSDLGGLKLWGDGVSLGFLMPGDPRPRAASWGGEQRLRQGIQQFTSQPGCSAGLDS